MHGKIILILEGLGKLKNLGFQKIPIARIRPPKVPMREPFVEPRFVESIKQNILASPIVNKLAVDEFQIIIGNRRFKAAMEAGLESIECRVVEATAEEIFKMTMAENLQRDDPSPMETAAFIWNYVFNSKKSVQEVALEANMNRTTLSNLLRVYRHPILSGEVAGRHYSMPAANLLLSIEPEKDCQEDYSNWKMFIDKHHGTSYHSLEKIVQEEMMLGMEKSGPSIAKDQILKKDERKSKFKKGNSEACDGCEEKFTDGELEIANLCPRCREILQKARKDITEDNPLLEPIEVEKTDQKPQELMQTRPVQPPGSDTSKTLRRRKSKPRVIEVTGMMSL
jgi:ParB family chromosome partitioning protein